MKECKDPTNMEDKFDRLIGAILTSALLTVILILIIIAVTSIYLGIAMVLGKTVAIIIGTLLICFAFIMTVLFYKGSS